MTDFSGWNPNYGAKAMPTGPSPPTASVAAWEPPVLSQAYAQAIRMVELPACTASIDTLLRAQGIRQDVEITGNPDAAGPAGDRRPSVASMNLDWVNKLYILVANGYLLQYAADGSPDRAVEKFVPLSKDSAAFASDLIPGRHWVLRVCSSLEAGSSSHQLGDSRSLLSRLPFRGSDRRQASNILLVFDAVEDMEGWMAFLRHEIGQLGGCKHLSETGPSTAGTQTVREPQRGSRVISPQDVPLPKVHRREFYMASAASAYDGDDVSPTNSIRSQDSSHPKHQRSQSSGTTQLRAPERHAIPRKCVASANKQSQSAGDSHSSHVENRGQVLGTDQTLPKPPPPVPNFSVPHRRFSGVLRAQSPDTIIPAGAQNLHQPPTPTHDVPPIAPDNLPPQDAKQQNKYKLFPAGTRAISYKLSSAFSRPSSDQPSPVLSPELPHANMTSPASFDRNTSSTASYGSEVDESPRVLRQHSFPSTLFSKSHGAVKEALARRSSAKELSELKEAKEVPAQKSSKKRWLRAAWAARFQRSDSKSSAVPYSGTLSPIPSPVQSRHRPLSPVSPDKPLPELPESPKSPEASTLLDLLPQNPILLPMPRAGRFQEEFDAARDPSHSRADASCEQVTPSLESASSSHDSYTVPRSLRTKTSTYSLADGPPPVPPPTCALPPLPPRSSALEA